jgi:hypothetical protein
MKRCILTVALIAITYSSFAADIDGTWSGYYPSPMGATIFKFTFKAEGKILNGMLVRKPADPNAIPPDPSLANIGWQGYRFTQWEWMNKKMSIKKGAIDLNHISFQTLENLGNGFYDTFFKGVMSGDQIELEMDMQLYRGSNVQKTLTLKRVK